jgi:DNA-binding response OmpR family regulator
VSTSTTGVRRLNVRNALLIEDSPEYQILIRAALKESFQVTFAVDAIDALSALTKESFDLILIDVGLPGRDGLSLCEELRKDPKFSLTPILFVTGRKETEDLVQGFAAGADDYIHKPFHPAELRARIEARLNRSTYNSSKVDKIHDSFWKADLHFQIGRQRVSYKDSAAPGAERDLNLTPNEFKILYHLAKNENRTLARADILREVWGEDLHVVERTVDKHICSLRRKMAQASQYVASVPGEGYMFRIQRAPAVTVA